MTEDFSRSTSAHLHQIDTLFNMIDRPGPSRYLSAAEAAARLGVNRASLYAYVSRGRIHAEADPKDPRASRYLAVDVERLRDRKQARQHPDTAARKTLSWGMPVLESGLTLIDGGRFYYRGHDALRLARQAPFERVVRLLWAVNHSDLNTSDVSWPSRRQIASLRSLPAMERMQAILPLAAAGDATAFDTSPETVARTGWRILHLLSAAAISPMADRPRPIAEVLARGWGLRSALARRLIDMALIVSADHELNTSAFAARVVASTGSSPYEVVLAALGALHGPRHGGYTARVEGFLDECVSPAGMRPTMSERLRRGEPVPGFGHPLYPDGDPRARLLFEMVETNWPNSKTTAYLRSGRRVGRELLGEYPSLDFGLVMVRRALGLPLGSALVLFAIGRTAGWIAHAMEQYAHEQLIRPRAAYIGPAPESA